MHLWKGRRGGRRGGRRRGRRRGRGLGGWEADDDHGRRLRDGGRPEPWSDEGIRGAVRGHGDTDLVGARGSTLARRRGVGRGGDAGHGGGEGATNQVRGDGSLNQLVGRSRGQGVRRAERTGAVGVAGRPRGLVVEHRLPGAVARGIGHLGVLVIPEPEVDDRGEDHEHDREHECGLYQDGALLAVVPAPHGTTTWDVPCSVTVPMSELSGHVMGRKVFATITCTSSPDLTVAVWHPVTVLDVVWSVTVTV